MGHIRALEESLDAIGLTTDFEPRFAFIAAKSRVQKDLKDAAKDVEQVFLAADDDREGEAIAYSVALLLKLPLATTPRIVFHEITEKAVQTAIANPRRLHMDRIWAQQARSMLDMMIGFTLSPLLWNHVARGLSAGRCQTPALKLVVEKEREIQAFKSASSWRLTGDFKSAAATSFPAILQDEAVNVATFVATLQDELEDEARDPHRAPEERAHERHALRRPAHRGFVLPRFVNVDRHLLAAYVALRSTSNDLQESGQSL
jgi:DNA topoisomerase-1